MLSLEEKELYNRHFLIEEFTEEHQKKLFEASVLVIGAGGLGTPVLLYLAGAGIGKLGIVEYDTIELSNLPRQVAYGKKDLGQLKTKIIREKLNFLNPLCNLDVYNDTWTRKNASQIVGGYDILIDCSDNFETRYLSDSISKKFNIPMVYGAIHEFEGQMSVFNYEGSKSYTDLFLEKEGQSSEKSVGVLGPLAGIIGSMQAAEAIKLITGLGKILTNRLFIISLKHNRIQYMNF